MLSCSPMFKDQWLFVPAISSASSTLDPLKSLLVLARSPTSCPFQHPPQCIRCSMFHSSNPAHKRPKWSAMLYQLLILMSSTLHRSSTIAPSLVVVHPSTKSLSAGLASTPPWRPGGCRSPEVGVPRCWRLGASANSIRGDVRPSTAPVEQATGTGDAAPMGHRERRPNVRYADPEWRL
jgi:hypothetical protein